MKTVYFATTNQEKMIIAQTVCEQVGISVEQVVVEIDEIQGEESELIVRDKAHRAYKKFGKPVIVSDDSWNIPALKGFPGPYMKSINHWFEPQDILKLMDGVKDRSIILHQYLAYNDGKDIKVFKNDIHGKIIHEVRGKNHKSPTTSVIVLDVDNGKTIAEIFDQGKDMVIERYKNQRDAWHELVEWYLKNPM
jgi:non-canonical purine NTP pyrophosphatase (RdgB/HAM1 family)